MTSIRISVVIPTADRPGYVKQAVESVVGQTFACHEIVVVDNGRVPLDANALPAIANLKIVRALPRFGVSQARNLGAIMATGTHVAFLDDDDMWDKRYLESVVNVLREHPDASVVLGRLRSMTDGRPKQGKQSEFDDEKDLIRQLLVKNPGAVGSSTTVAKVDLMKTSGYDPWLTTGQDKALVLDIALRGGKIVRADDAWVEFRDDVEGERQTDIHKRILGKWRFTWKYWRVMPVTARFVNLAWVVRLQLMSWAGRDR